MADEPSALIAEATAGLGGRFLSFDLEGTSYGVPISEVREIIRPLDVTRVPRTPSILRGVMNLRGKIVPVLDLREILGMERVEATDESRIIVLERGAAEVGVVVDRVCEVTAIVDEAISEPPEFGERVDTRIVLGMGKVGVKVTILLDLDQALESTGCSL